MGAACGGGGGEAVDPEMKKIDEQVRARTAAAPWLPLAPAAVPPPRALPEGGGSGHYAPSSWHSARGSARAVAVCALACQEGAL
eukprot:scaffold27822_cov67-Phaeocystis_antarctica.AAC.2